MSGVNWGREANPTSWGIFEKSYYDFLEKYGDLNNYNVKTVFIDGTMIYNKYGSDNISINPTDPKKKTTKIVAVTTTKNNIFKKCIPLSITACEAATVHDTNTISDAINKIPLKLKSNNIDLYGDKGYMLKKERKEILAKSGVKITVPYRKNQKNRISAS